ncbi:hypothetical protein BJ138DRAFT_1147354 [Hygrophoropsis aurantiaca]|uniref:Uncharacterized protein n=1 Tax=Hygrophoropsis aurantiaca TaxID=72124 RepID=A0ACB8AHK1_9AGAM|nr:hypothetical protein BJ138DRAFT_1147354 [Hygrophoropsis aurantiaca]
MDLTSWRILAYLKRNMIGQVIERLVTSTSLMEFLTRRTSLWGSFCNINYNRGQPVIQIQTHQQPYPLIFAIMPKAKSTKPDTRKVPYKVESAGSKNSEKGEGYGSPGTAQAIADAASSEDPLEGPTQQTATTVPDEHSTLTPQKDDLDGYAGVVSNNAEQTNENKNGNNVAGTSTSAQPANKIKVAAKTKAKPKPKRKPKRSRIRPARVTYDIDEMYGEPNFFDGMPADDADAFSVYFLFDILPMLTIPVATLFRRSGQ